jgi:hypothetical protein
VKIPDAESISTLTPEAQNNTPPIAFQAADNIPDTPLLSGLEFIR